MCAVSEVRTRRSRQLCVLPAEESKRVCECVVCRVLLMCRRARASVCIVWTAVEVEAAALDEALGRGARASSIRLQNINGLLLRCTMILSVEFLTGLRSVYHPGLEIADTTSRAVARAPCVPRRCGPSDLHGRTSVPRVDATCYAAMWTRRTGAPP